MQKMESGKQQKQHGGGRPCFKETWWKQHLRCFLGGSSNLHPVLYVSLETKPLAPRVLWEILAPNNSDTSRDKRAALNDPLLNLGQSYTSFRMAHSQTHKMVYFFL
jgi:hypothetical protein